MKCRRRWGSGSTSLLLVFVACQATGSDDGSATETDVPSTSSTVGTTQTEPPEEDDDSRDTTSGSTTGSTSALTSGSTTGNESSESSSSGEPLASCGAIAESFTGAATCRDEPSRCSLTVPVGSSCAETCEAMAWSCLRAYPESEACVPAVYLEEVDCAVPAAVPTFCQCGDLAQVHPPALVVTIGDSTMDNTGVRGESGWGNELPPFAVRPEDIHNQGSSGASSLDFETRPNWPMAEALLGPNVYLLIQFGHNDTSDDPNRHTEPGVPPEYDGTYHERLLFYVDAARDAGATPVILTSLGTMSFNRDGTTTPGYMAEYVLSARKFAEDEGLMLFDANAASRGEYERLGPEQTIELYSFDEQTHFTPAGAMRMAELTVRLGCVEDEAFCAQFMPL